MSSVFNFSKNSAKNRSTITILDEITGFLNTPNLWWSKKLFDLEAFELPAKIKIIKNEILLQENLEHIFVKLIQYDISVSASLYNKYLGEIRSLFAMHFSGVCFPLKPLSRLLERRLEIRSKSIETSFKNACFRICLYSLTTVLSKKMRTINDN